MLSYLALLQASTQAPILLDGLAQAPTKVQTTVLALLQHAPLTTFLQVSEVRGKATPTSRLHEIFTPAALEMVGAH